MLHRVNAVLASLRRLAQQREGNVAMLVGLFAIPRVIAGRHRDRRRPRLFGEGPARRGARRGGARCRIGDQSDPTQMSDRPATLFLRQLSVDGARHTMSR